MSPWRPRFGFLWLVGNLAALAAGYAYLQQPFWFEREEPQRIREHLAYLLRLARHSEGPDRTHWQDQYWQQALVAARAGAGSWEIAFDALDTLHAAGLEPPGTCLAPGLCWSVTAIHDMPQVGAALLVRNPGPATRTARLRFTCDDPDAHFVVHDPIRGVVPLVRGTDGLDHELGPLPAGRTVLVPVLGNAKARLVAVAFTRD